MQIASNTLLSARALLFDMDGTLVDSTAAVELVWGQWAAKHGVSFADVAHKMHGRRAIEIMRDLTPAGIDLNFDEEIKFVDEQEVIQLDGIVPIPGAAELIAALPRGSWALVTSARPPLARARMGAAGLPIPDFLVTSADVTQGKPHPECYLRALKLLGVSAEQALVFEDAQAGLASGRAAGCRTIALATTTESHDLDHEDWVHDLSCVVLEDVLADGTLQLRIV